ncbi:MAG TPA: hypothetical protein VNL71_22040 [Chloroflexota bacterium]|nr:hypothetical protein [Chloroflexota bacterium]
MPGVRPQLDISTVEAFLRQHLDAPVEDVRGLRGGEISTAFAYSLAGERYVIRFGARESGFFHDRFACERFAPPGIPIPRIHEIGRFGELAFAVSPYVPAGTIQHLPAARQEALASATHATLVWPRSASSPIRANAGPIAGREAGSDASERSVNVAQ